MDYSVETRSIIFWLSVALIPFSLSAVCEGVFQAHEEMRYIAWGSVPVNVLKVCAAFVLLWTGAGLDRVLVLIVACHIAIMTSEWGLMVRRFPPTSIAINPRFASALLRSTSTFLGIDVVIALFGSLEILLLSRLATEADVGVFSAAVQVLLPVTLLFQNVVASAFPTLCRHFQSGVQSLRQTAAELVGLLLAISLPAALALFWVADRVLSLLFGDRLQAAETPLRILAWCLVLRAVTAALGQVLLASRRERVTLRIVTVDALTSFTVGLLLIPHFGVVGAAITALVTRVVDLTQHILAVAPIFSGYSLSLGWAARLKTGSMRLWTE
jgi:O-antigen/teichoic acid export membrane protein